MQKTQNSSETYKALGTIEGIQTRPQMYIGDTTDPSHLLVEVVDNLFDEILQYKCTWGGIQYDKENGSYWVYDKGRGIDIYDMIMSNGKTQDSVITLLTHLHSGSKFDADKTASIGMNGVGLVAVNALSDWVIVKIRDKIDKNTVYEYIFEYSKFKYRNIYSNDVESFSTLIGFKPRAEFFDNEAIDLKPFVERLLLCQSKVNYCNLFFNNKQIPKMSFEDFVKTQLNLKKDVPLYQLVSQNGNDKLNLFITYDPNEETRITGDVNLRLCEGTYLNNIQTYIKNSLSNKLKDYDQKDLNRLMLLGLKVYASLILEDPRFDSQNKLKMTKSIAKDLLAPIKDNFDWLVNQPHIVKTIQSIIENKLKKSITKSLSKSKISSDSKLKDCTNNIGDILYIVEGDSAGGTLKQCRNIKTEAVFPLTGKILNVEKASFQKINNNKVVKFLLEAIGDKKSPRYKQIKILADADQDGMHISALVILLIAKFYEPVVRAGNLKVILPPLWAAHKRNNKIFIYNEKDVDSYKKQGYTLVRFKGLGEMNPAQLKQVITSGKQYTVTYPDSLDSVMELIYNSKFKQKLLNDNRFSFETLFKMAEDI